MPRPRLLILCLLLGILTTIAIAWTLALWHSPPLNGFTLSVLIDPNDNSRERAVYINQEYRAGVCSVFFSTSAATPTSIGPSWAPLGSATTGTPFWTLKPTHRPAIDRIVADFAKLNADDPSAERILPDWPSWLPDIPATHDGLLCHGGRAAGWPFLTLRSTLNVDPAAREDHWLGSWRLIPATSYLGRGRLTLQDPASGCVPLIPTTAFPLSACMWAAAWLVLLGTPRLLRGSRRRRAGRCTACGYDLRGVTTGSACPECGARNDPSITREPQHPC